MTVAEAIKILKTMPESATLVDWAEHENDPWSPIRELILDEKNNRVEIWA